MSSLVVTGTVYGQSSVQQGHKRGDKVAEAVDLTFGDQIVSLYARLSDLP